MSDPERTQTGKDTIKILQTLALDHELARARALVHGDGLDHARARALADALASASAHARALDHNLARALDHNLALARDLASSIASLRPSAIDLSRDLAIELPRLFDLVSNLARDVNDIPIDVSGVDLSHLALRQYLDELDGVVWSDDTCWPPGVADLVATRSEEIRRGVYQVRGGSERETR